MDFANRFRCRRNWMLLVLLLFGGAQRAFPDTSAAKLSRQSAPATEIAESGNRAVPDWFLQGAVFSDENGMLFVQTDSACMNLVQAGEALELESLRAVNAILDDWFGTGAGEKMGLTGNDLFENFLFQSRKEIRIDGDLELADMSNDHNGPDEREYYCGFAQLHLDGKFRKFADNRWQAVKTGQRLVRSGLVGGSILAILAIAFGYLRMETATRGFYSRRLQTVSLLGVLLIMAVAFWFNLIFLGP